jgi:hypothetical protein
MQGRLPDDFRQRVKRYAAFVIRLFVKLPKTQEEVRILGKQLLRSGTSVAAHVREASRAVLMLSLSPSWAVPFKRPTNPCSGSNFSVKNAPSPRPLTKPLEDESSELIAIFTSMINRTPDRGA